jgi:hypothetical protein
MKARKLFVVALAFGGFTAGMTAFAQTSQSVNSSATVTTPITGASTAALAFGTVTKGQANTVASSAAGAGAFNFSGDESDDITITVPATVTLNTTSGGGASMNVTLDRAGMGSNSTDNTQGSAVTADASSGTVTVALSADAAGDGTDADGLGQSYFWIGGSVTPAANQQRGSYTGTFSVSASYSN